MNCNCATLAPSYIFWQTLQLPFNTDITTLTLFLSHTLHSNSYFYGETCLASFPHPWLFLSICSESVHPLGTDQNLISSFTIPIVFLCLFCFSYCTWLHPVNIMFTFHMSKPSLITKLTGLGRGTLTNLCLCYSIVYCYNGAKRYEQFLQVGWLDRALISLALALSSEHLRIVGLHGSIYIVRGS